MALELMISKLLRSRLFREWHLLLKTATPASEGHPLAAADLQAAGK